MRQALAEAADIVDPPPGNPQVTEQVPDASPPQIGGYVDSDPAHASEDPNDPDPAHHAPGWKPPASTPVVPVPNEHTQEQVAAKFGANTWLGAWSGNVKDTVSQEVNRSHDDVSVLIEYNIPGRDNGNYSSGGLATPYQYDAWTKQVADGIGEEPAWVIVEPDAIGLMDGLSVDQQSERYDMLQQAINNYQTADNARVYVDLSVWLGVDEAAKRIKNLSGMHGFSLNVSGYNDLQTMLAFGDAVARKTGLHYVIDTSRNGYGNPHSPMWCNVTDTKIGHEVTTSTASEYCDAYLWLKVPGESDGLGINDDGSHPRDDVPAAGVFWPEYHDAIYSGDWTAFKQKYKI